MRTSIIIWREEFRIKLIIAMIIPSLIIFLLGIIYLLIFGENSLNKVIDNEKYKNRLSIFIIIIFAISSLILAFNHRPYPLQKQ